MVKRREKKGAIALLIAAVTVLSLFALPGCGSKDAKVSEENYKPNYLTSDERSVLEEIYSTVGDKLTSRQQEIVDGYRRLSKYINTKYGSYIMERTDFNPGGGLLSPSYDEYRFKDMNTGEYSTFYVEKGEDGSWKIYDGIQKEWQDIS